MPSLPGRQPGAEGSEAAQVDGDRDGRRGGDAGRDERPRLRIAGVLAELPENVDDGRAERGRDEEPMRPGDRAGNALAHARLVAEPRGGAPSTSVCSTASWRTPFVATDSPPRIVRRPDQSVKRPPASSTM